MRKKINLLNNMRICVFKKNASNILFLTEMVLLVLVCIVHSLSAGHYVNFIPFNGTFQNFNPVRRFIDGQIPYADFQDYLGLGHLYSGTIMTILFGGNYRASLWAFSFLTFGGMAAISLVISLVVIERKEIAGALTDILVIMILVEPLFFKYALAGTDSIFSSLACSTGVGNSARFVRGMILPLSCFGIYLGYFFYKSIIVKKFYRYREILKPLGVGLVAGCAFAWSNDYGICCWLCVLLMVLWVTFCRQKRVIDALKNMAIALFASLVALFFTVEIITLGNVESWLLSTFGAGNYQSWYYNSIKSYFLYDVDFSFVMLLQMGISIVYLYKLLKHMGSAYAIKRYGIPAYVNMVSFCAANEYRLLSGGDLHEVALSVLFFSIITELFVRLSSIWNGECFVKNMCTVSIICCLAWLITNVKGETVFYVMTEKEGVEVEELGGNLTSLGRDLKRTAEFLGESDFFATYASAQEVVCDKYQPSGTDYIIHVLGDSQREGYLKSFEEGNFEYTATLSKEYADWECWIERANWFFYRELYAKWHPVYANTYELYWERNQGDEKNEVRGNIDCCIQNIDDNTKKIIISCDSSINGMADVYVDYSVKKRKNESAMLTIYTDLLVENTGTLYAAEGAFFESNHLRNESAEYIPIPICNGYGEVTLTSNPLNSTYLELNDVCCDTIYTSYDKYVKINAINENVFTVANSERAKNNLRDVRSVSYEGKMYNVEGVTYESDCITILVEEDIEENIAKCNQLKIE